MIVVLNNQSFSLHFAQFLLPHLYWLWITVIVLILGSIIRCFRRLEELLRQMVGAAKSMGNEDMEKTFEEARLKLKRDIVFAASLYI